MELPAKLRIGALDLSDMVSEKIGSFAYYEFFQFLAADGDTVHLWYVNSGGKGPSVEITLHRHVDGWTADLKEHPPGTEQTIEQP